MSDGLDNKKGALQKITLGGGCFWCLEAVFDDLQGVHDVVSGYAGGKVPKPTYREVCTGRTGHAEVVQLAFDAEEITLREILEVFFAIHDPTTLNRQGADVGTQYRSAIFYHDEAQRQVAEQVIAELDENGPWQDPIVTEVTALNAFYEAEDYHQEYYRYNGDQPYCRVVIDPKVAKFRQRFTSRLKSRATG